MSASSSTAATTLLQMINDILDFSRLESGRVDLEDTAFDVRALLRSTLDLLQTEAASKGLTLAMEVADGRAGPRRRRPRAAAPGAHQPDRQRPEIHQRGAACGCT